MRWGILLVGLFACCVLARAEDDKEARALVEKVIAAIGKKSLEAEGSFSGKSKGTIDANGAKLAISNDWLVQGTDRMKWTTELTNDGKTSTVTLGIDKNTVWIKGGDKANDLPKEYHTPFRQAFAALRLVENPLLLLGKGVKLSHLGEVKIDDKPAVGVKVTRDKEPDIDMFFDKKTLLPIKASMRIKDAGGGSEDVDYVGHFSDHKKFDDRMCFTQMKLERDGKVVLDVERSDIKTGEKQDESTFTKP